MPDSAKCVAQSLCEACAALEDPSCLTSSHLEYCIHMFSRERLSANFAEPGASTQQDPRNGCAGLCDNCPMRLKSPQLQTNPQLPAASTSTPLLNEETSRVTATPDFPGVRLRPGQKKLHVEHRPPRFKKKLWFGSYSQQSVFRACDAKKFYTGCKKGQYRLSDSEETFAKYPLKINFKDLDRNCNNDIFVGSQVVKAHLYFGQEVRRVIKAVLDQDKNAAQIAHERKVVSQKMRVGKTSPNPVQLPTLPIFCKVGAPLMNPASIEDAESSARPSAPSWHNIIGENFANTLLASTSSGLAATPFFRTNAASRTINVLGDTERAHVVGFEIKAGDPKDMPGEEDDAAIKPSGATTCSVDDLLLFSEPADFGGGPYVPLTDEDLDSTLSYLLRWLGGGSEECRGIHNICDDFSLT